MKIILRIVFIFFAITVGLYPLMYVLVNMGQGLLASKPPEVLASRLWHFAFYTHISFGGLALLSGWSQFLAGFRHRYPGFHRALGKVYLVTVLLSGTAGLYIAWFATGGLIPISGFTALAVSWLLTTAFAYRAIRRGDIDQHQYWMIRSYGLCFAAVTLRIWLPLFQFAAGMDFVTAYRIIAWLCWVPNLLVAELIIRSLKASRLVRSV